MTQRRLHRLRVARLGPVARVAPTLSKATICGAPAAAAAPRGPRAPPARPRRSRSAGRRASARWGPCPAARAAPRPRRRADRQLEREDRAVAGRERSAIGALISSRQPLDDRQPEAEPLLAARRAPPSACRAPGRTPRRCAPAPRRRCPGRCPRPARGRRSPRAPAADQHRAVVGVADRVRRPGCARCARPAAGRRARRACRRESAAPGPSRTPSARSAGAACGRCRRSRSSAGCTSTPPLSMRVMSSSSENRPSSASTDSLMLLTSCATSGSWVRWRSASANRPIACSGWRRSWLAAVKNWVLARLATSASLARRVGDRLLGAQLLGQRLGAQLQGDDAVERRRGSCGRGAMIIAIATAITAASCQLSSTCCDRDARDRRHEAPASRRRRTARNCGARIGTLATQKV